MLNNRIRDPGQPTLPGIVFTPARVRTHGLTEAHSWPYVSRGKRPDGGMSLFRVPASKAWDYSEIELRSETAWPCVILDLDRETALEGLWDRILGGHLPEPNWTVERLANGHAHAVYTLARPVHRGATARQTPLRYFARVSEYLAITAGADRGYNGLTAHNPMPATHALQPGGFRTAWVREDAYTLAELAEPIPKGWRMPAKPVTEGGRNCLLFEQACKWAGHRMQAGEYPPVLDYIRQLNTELDPALGDRELIGIAKSVERYRERWKREGHQMSFINKQAALGRKSGKARRRKVSERNEAIMAMLNEGHTQADVALHFGVSQQTVSYVKKQAVAEGSLVYTNQCSVRTNEPIQDDPPSLPLSQGSRVSDPKPAAVSEKGEGVTGGEPRPRNRRPTERQMADLHNQLRNQALAALAAWDRDNPTE